MTLVGKPVSTFPDFRILLYAVSLAKWPQIGRTPDIIWGWARIKSIAKLGGSSAGDGR
jgi:hypothetical protein